MRECRVCGEFIRKAWDRLPSRCPNCREPLFERPGGPQLVAETDAPDRGVCALHAGNVAAGTCKRCGNFFCTVCRTRWQERPLCVTCVEQLLSRENDLTELQKEHNRQATVGLACGLGAWGCVVLAVLCVAGFAASQANVGLMILGWLLAVGSLLPAALGVGQAFNALRLRGDRMHAATAGLVLSGLHLGVVVGLVLTALTVS